MILKKRYFSLLMAAAVTAAAGSLCPVRAFGRAEPSGEEAAGSELLRTMAQAFPEAALRLTAVPDYSAGDRKGAVKLQWERKDGEGRAYLIYQKEEQGEFRQIFFGSDEETELFQELVWEYEGSTQSLVIPSAGFYSLAAQGAQGGNCGSYAGGLGGRTEAAFYLEKDEKLFITVGGQNGFGGGGRATDFGNGGGCTVISSDRKGILLVAGGGGGATSGCGGLQGGRPVNLSAQGIDSGREGMAGGGGGSAGGRAGTRIVHIHSQEGGCYRDGSYDAASSGLAGRLIEREWWDEERDWEDDSYIRSDFYFSSQAGVSGNLIPVKGNTVLELGAWVYGEGINFIDGRTYIQVTDQNGAVLYSSSIGKLRQEWNAFETAARGGVYRGWPSVANVSTYTDWSQSSPPDGDYDILDTYEVSYPIFYENGTARVAKVYLNSEYASPIFAGNYAGEYYPPEDPWRSDILSHRGYGDRPLLFCDRSRWYGMSGVHFLQRIFLPEGTAGIRVYAEGMMDTLQYHEGERIKKPLKGCTVRFDKLRLSGSMLLDCAAEDINLPAEGGGSYVNKKYALSWQMWEGIGRGSGNAWIRADKTGLTEAGGMDAVPAQDKAAPYAVDTDTVTMSAAGDHVALIEFEAVEDKGTEYLFRAVAYSILTGERLCGSNIVRCLMKTGVEGYFYLVDSYEDTELSPDTANTSWQFISAGNRRIRARIDQRVQYLHIAAADRAGNISDTVHIKLAPDSVGILWEVSAEAMEISSVVEGRDYGSVYPAQGENAYYVKADGCTPFLLSFRSCMHGPTRADYQISHLIYDLRTEDLAQRHRLLLPYSEASESAEELAAALLEPWAEGALILTDISYRGAVRSRRAETVDCWRAFVMSASLNGRTVAAVPVAGAAYGDKILFSHWDDDARHSVTLIGDGEGPVIRGMEKVADWELLDRGQGDVMLEVSAEDALSGVKEFYLEIRNQDNLLEKRIFPDEDGNITVCLTDEDPLFGGVFTVAAYAEDNVGNKTGVNGEITEFALTAEVIRILQPHEPMFKQGESGILSLEAWGYAEKVEVEFPDFLAGYNRTFLYDSLPQHRQSQEIQFMIPLGAPEGTYEITVRAYKGDKRLEAHPAISALEVNGSVLDELRTRLR